MTPDPVDISRLSAEELEALQADAEGRPLERQPLAERWWIGAMIATVVLLVLVGLIQFAAGIGETKRSIERGEGTATHVMGGEH